MNPQVSVIIPTYNSEKYIARAIESVLQQTEPNVEVIVVDDASHDATTEVVKRYCCDRLKMLVNERNRGPSYTRNQGIKEAKGEWIALLDSDDWYAPERLEKLLQVAYTEKADFVVDDLYLITDGAEKPWSTRFSQNWGFGSRQPSFNKSTQLDAVDFIELDLGLVKPIIKRNFLAHHDLKFNEELRYGEDFQLFLISLLNKAKFIVIPEPYYFYCSRPNSLITEPLKCQEQMHWAALTILETEAVKNNPKLMNSLANRLEKLDKSIKTFISYKRVMSPLKQGRMSAAITEILRNPLFFRFVRLEILRRITNRLSKLRAKLFISSHVGANSSN